MFLWLWHNFVPHQSQASSDVQMMSGGLSLHYKMSVSIANSLAITSENSHGIVPKFVILMIIIYLLIKSYIEHSIEHSMLL